MHFNDDGLDALLELNQEPGISVLLHIFVKLAIARHIDDAKITVRRKLLAEAQTLLESAERGQSDEYLLKKADSELKWNKQLVDEDEKMLAQRHTPPARRVAKMNVIVGRREPAGKSSVTASGRGQEDVEAAATEEVDNVVGVATSCPSLPLAPEVHADETKTVLPHRPAAVTEKSRPNEA